MLNLLDPATRLPLPAAPERTEIQVAMDFHLEGRHAEAEAIYERLRAEYPDEFHVNHLLGVLRYQQERPAEALELLEKACRIRPLCALTFMCRGLALDSLGRGAEAEKSLLLAVGLDPQSFDVWSNLAAHYFVVGRMAEAIDGFKRSVALKPDYAHAWTGLGSALHMSGRVLEGVVCHTRALELEPAQPRAHFARAQALQACHCVEESIADFDAQLVLRPDHLEARSFRLFMLNYRDRLTPSQLFAEHLAYGSAVAADAAARDRGRALPRRTLRGSRLRVAFLSPDLRTHSVVFFLEPLLRELDRSRFEVFLYHDHYTVDAVSERLRGLADCWRHFSAQASDVVEKTIREDAPDVLVDLAGHTGFNRMEMLARRVAPVQIAYLGYPNTTGLRTMDYRFTDAVADPEGAADRLHSERLVRFAPVAWTYAPPADAPEPAPGPGRSGEPVTFGSFNALSKVGATTLQLWREVLAAVPRSRLFLKSGGLVRERWERLLGEAGIDLRRVQLAPATPGIAEHLALYSQVDIALDPFPYNGTTTSVEALWMGVPLITLLGNRHASRVGASLLTAVRHSEWIAATPADYVQIAVNLAAAEDLRQRLRTDLREHLRTSALLDHRGQAARFGAALQACFAGSFPPAAG